MSGEGRCEYCNCATQIVCGQLFHLNGSFAKAGRICTCGCDTPVEQTKLVMRITPYYRKDIAYVIHFIESRRNLQLNQLIRHMSKYWNCSINIAKNVILGMIHDGIIENLEVD